MYPIFLFPYRHQAANLRPLPFQPVFLFQSTSYGCQRIQNLPHCSHVPMVFYALSNTFQNNPWSYRSSKPNPEPDYVWYYKCVWQAHILKQHGFDIFPEFLLLKESDPHRRYFLWHPAMYITDWHNFPLCQHRQFHASALWAQSAQHADTSPENNPADSLLFLQFLLHTVFFPIHFRFR